MDNLFGCDFPLFCDHMELINMVMNLEIYRQADRLVHDAPRHPGSRLSLTPSWACTAPTPSHFSTWLREAIRALLGFR